LGVLVGEDGNLVGEVVDGGLGIGKSSLERRTFSSKLVELVGEVGDISLKVHD